MFSFILVGGKDEMASVYSQSKDINGQDLCFIHKRQLVGEKVNNDLYITNINRLMNKYALFVNFIHSCIKRDRHYR